jgi:RNA polymerase sigma factor (sigma-70 family)
MKQAAPHVRTTGVAAAAARVALGRGREDELSISRRAMARYNLGCINRENDNVPDALANLSDVELVDQVVAGAPGAAQEFYRRHSRLIYHCIRARAGRQDVDDVFQAFFERLIRSGWRPLRLWQRGTSLPVYLSTVVRNFVVDFHRAKRWREESIGGDAELEALGVEQFDGVSGAPLRELRRVGIRAWAKLEARDRRLVCDRMHRDLDNQTMALRLELSAGALRTALSRAQSRFLAQVRRLAPEFFPDEP